MEEEARRLVAEFFAALGRGELPAHLMAEEFSAWILTSGEMEGSRFVLGVRLLGEIFGGTLTYEVDSVTAEGDRIAAEVRSHGRFTDGEPFANVHVFVLELCEGKIARVKEYMDPGPVRTQIGPRLAARLEGGGGAR